jgi:MFS family permease
VARYPQRALIAAGFLVAIVGLVLMIPFVDTSQRAVAFLLGLFLFGLGVGAMLTPSVNVVQSSFPEEMQGEISGLSRSVSNLGSSFGTAIAGTILVSAISTGTRSYVVAMIVLVGFALLGLVAALRLPREAGQPDTRTEVAASPT